MDLMRLLHSREDRPQNFTVHEIRPSIDFWLILYICRVIFCQFLTANLGLTTGCMDIVGISDDDRWGHPLPYVKTKISYLPPRSNRGRFRTAIKLGLKYTPYKCLYKKLSAGVGHKPKIVLVTARPPL